jgi:imidazole glycerol-phosphate synthase subunit HisF
MLRPRIIPCLLVHKGGLVKTVQFKDAKYVGDPINAVKIFNEKEADELIVVDIDASRNGVAPDFTLITRLAVECRMPLCYGGGVKSADQARRIIGLGVEKVAIGSAALDDPGLVPAVAAEIGSQSVVVVLDVRPKGDSYEVWTHNAMRASGVDAFDAARRAADSGAGEIVVNCIERDGRMGGYDVPLAVRMRASMGLPLTMLGGAGSLVHMTELIRECGVVGAAAGSLFVFKGPYRAVLINYPSPERRDEVLAAARLARTASAS